MNITQELINILQGIHDGKPWQWNDSKDSWLDALDRNNAIGLVCSGYKIRLKPEQDPYAEAKQAWKDGELQHRLSDNCDWGDWPFKSEPTWCCVPSRYRRKPKPIPKPVRVPLGPEDVPPGSVFRMPDDSGWMLANEISRGSIRIGREPLTFDCLMQYGWLINRPANRGENGKPTKWEPCWKEGE